MNSRLRGLLVAVLCYSASFSVNASLNVLACEPEWKALAEELGGEQVQAQSATHARQDPHHIEARPSLIIKARDADLVFCTGAELEIGWLPLLLEKSRNRQIQLGQPGHFLAASQVHLIEVPENADRSQGDVHADGNPHVHLDPQRLLAVAEAFSARLQLVDADNAEYYRERLAAFSSSWTQAMEDWQTQARALQGKQAVVYHKNWSYLLDWLQIDTVGDLEPKPGIPPTSGHLAELLQSTRAQGADFILIANYQNTRGAQWLSDNSDIAMLELPFTVGGSAEAEDLYSLYDTILARLLTGS